MHFSVLLTVYKNDVPTHFERALKSITLEQSLKASEIVIVCDGPVTPEHESIIKKYQQDESSNIQVIKLQSNVGQGNALNKGLEECTYEYIARMDSDDISRVDRFKEQMDYLSKHPDIDVLSSSVHEFNDEGDLSDRVLPEQHEQLLQFAKLRAPVNHGTCMYKKSKVLAVGGYSDLIQIQDYKLWVDLILIGCQFHNLAQVHLDVRMDDLYGRKRGVVYFKEELFFQNYMYKKNIINRYEYVKYLFIRTLPRLLPTMIVNFTYSFMLRNAPQKM